MQITSALAAILAIFTLSACGDDTPTNANSETQDRRVEAPANEATTALKVVATEAAVTPKVPTPMPQPVNPIIAFNSEDGSLALPRNALTMISPVHDIETDVWSVFIQLDKQSAEDFYTLTSETAGEALAVVVDDMTVSAPILETAVYGGGFVFKVDNSDVASNVVATLKGETTPPTIVTIDVEDALQSDVEPDDDNDTAATVNESEDS